MKIGIQTFFGGGQRGLLAEHIRQVGEAIEERGFASVWMSEHVVTFPRYDPAYPYPYADDGKAPDFLFQTGMLDPLSALTALAMCTRRIGLGSGIAILPQRNPVYFAKMGTAIDQISGGRFLAGVGLGWSAQEFEATATPWEHRGSRMRDYVEVVRALWSGEVASYRGAHYSLPECRQLPAPIQRPHPPFYFGGESEPALRRVARYGQGWLAYRVTPELIAPALERLDALLAGQGRSRADVDIIASPGDRPCDERAIERFAELGVSQLTFPVVSDDIDDYRRQLDALASTRLTFAEAL